MDKKINVVVIGAGSWGTTLSVMLAEKGYHVFLWVRDKKSADLVSCKRKNEKYTGDLLLPSNITIFNNLKEICRYPDIIIFAVPSHALREVVGYLYDYLDDLDAKAIVNAAKGLEAGTHLRLSEVLAKTLPPGLAQRVAVLSGPNISSEIARKLPSVSIISSNNKNILGFLQKGLSTDYFRVYTNHDLAGVELGGAVKNIIAIAAGISDGLGYGTNTKASLVTRGLHEITRFGIKMGGRPLTFSGISGMGDLITTCFNLRSRNRILGQRIAQGEKPGRARKEIAMVAEGYNSAQSVYSLCRNLDIDMPITDSVYDILYHGADPRRSVYKLMARKFKPEIEVR